MFHIYMVTPALLILAIIEILNLNDYSRDLLVI
jgi:hypothetical protein